MEDVIIVSIVFGFAAFIAGGIYRLIRLKIERNTGIDEEVFDRLARAFMQYKKDTERRLRNLEAIVDNEDSSASASGKQLNEPEPHKTIEIEDAETEGETEKQNKSDSEDRNLRNMLRN